MYLVIISEGRFCNVNQCQRNDYTGNFSNDSGVELSLTLTDMTTSPAPVLTLTGYYTTFLVVMGIPAVAGPLLSQEFELTVPRL